MKSDGPGKPVNDQLTLSRQSRSQLVKGLLNWFANHKRALPWRATRDP